MYGEVPPVISTRIAESQAEVSISRSAGGPPTVRVTGSASQLLIETFNV